MGFLGNQAASVSGTQQQPFGFPQLPLSPGKNPPVMGVPSVAGAPAAPVHQKAIMPDPNNPGATMWAPGGRERLFGRLAGSGGFLAPLFQYALNNPGFGYGKDKNYLGALTPPPGGM